MSKSNSGLYRGTTGLSIPEFEKIFIDSIGEESTVVVWSHIKATQEVYPNSKIPKSFVVDVPITAKTPDGKMWTHVNATEHIYEAINSTKSDPRLKESNPDLYSQFILYDFYKTLGKAVSQSFNYESAIKIGNWEFAFAKARNESTFPVVKHALFQGLENEVK